MPGTVQSPKAQIDDDIRAQIPTRELGDAKIAYDVLKFIPQESAEHYKLAPLGVVDGILEIGMVDPDDLGAYDALNFIAKSTGMPFKVFKISDDDLVKVIEMYRGLGGEVDRAVSDLATEQKGNEPPPTSDSEAAFLDLDDPLLAKKRSQGPEGPEIQEDAPTIKIASTILRYAIDGRASDIHIEPGYNGVRVRYRVDGDLHTSVILPLTAHRALTARIKVLASIRLDERRKPQDGRFSASIDGREVDFRVSTLPSYYGEKIVIRILDRKQGFIPLDQIGLTERNLKLMRKAIEAPHGLILVSGPTGSGKSTTLYSLLAEVDREKKNVLSLEDPIEYFVEGVTQSQVRPEIGYSFANGLRTTLRQDPDVIMVGEIRDAETAQLAIQAALTGHLVLSTIHTNDAVGTVTRLVDMGVEPYLIPPVLIASVAQRLTRTFCEGGEKEVEITPSQIEDIHTEMRSLPEKYRFPLANKAWEPQGTPTCPTGLRGRMAVFEIMEMTPTLEKIILENPIETKIWAAARAQGMLTMREDAILKAFDKKIPFSEINNLSSVLLDDEESTVAPAPEDLQVGEATPEKTEEQEK
ncbi:MAG TPA: GspE/PulE family protein [Candidatus Paceibacterota bacterium]|nr:GspE/PulE family protein [Candidatus Paceibacterota bacterium]